MTYKYEYMTGRCAYNLEKCEEEIFIAGYVETLRFIPSGQIWQRGLEDRFFERGEGLACEYLNEVNTVRMGHGLEQIEFRETALGDYALSRDKLMKSQRRCQIRAEFTVASDEVLAKRRAKARDEEKGLPPPRYTPPPYPYEEFQLRKRQQNAAAPLRQEEVDERASTCRPGDMPGVIPIGLRMPPSSERHANFRRLAERRTERLLKELRILENLSSPNYEFEDLEVEKIFATIQERLDGASFFATGQRTDFAE